jgi:hypothetical protein
MPNIPSCSTLVTLESNDVIPVTNFCKAIKVIKNIESNSVGVKLLSGSCNIQIKDKIDFIFQWTRFFNDFSKVGHRRLIY